ncbi:unnamed protein product [Meganyctiphanes norvegica]|uniref:ATP synthase F0 subunit 8 n=1 Tax=Meganyctiphanes norvegica TaxID=48144 RepID=A0AAV2SCT3_MEGNR
MVQSVELHSQFSCPLQTCYFGTLFGMFWIFFFLLFFLLKIIWSRTPRNSLRSQNPRLSILIGPLFLRGPLKRIILGPGISDFFRWVLDHIILKKNRPKCTKNNPLLGEPQK